MATHSLHPAAAFFGRLFWIIAGPFLLVVLALEIAQRPRGGPTLADLAFFLVLGGMLLGRWLEFRYGEPTTGTGAPATPAHLRRYLATTTAVGLAAWMAVKLTELTWLSR